MGRIFWIINSVSLPVVCMFVGMHHFFQAAQTRKLAYKILLTYKFSKIFSYNPLYFSCLVVILTSFICDFIYLIILFFGWVWLKVYNSVDLFKESTPGFIDLFHWSTVFCGFYNIYFCSNLNISLFLLALRFICSFLAHLGVRLGCSFET